MKRLILLLAVACNQPAMPGGGGAPSVSASERPVAKPTPAELSRAARAARFDACRSRIARVVEMPGLSGAPKLEAKRAQILGRAKATPVLFTSEPVFDKSESAAVRFLRDELGRDPSARTLGRIYHMLHRRPELARAVLLRQGYLYTDEPNLAFALLQKVELGDLFEDAEIVIQRGGELLGATRQKDGYVYASGTHAGEPAKVLLFDRVWSSAAPVGPPLHVDLEPLAASLGFWRARLERATESALVVDLLYGDQWVKSLLTRQGATVHLDCELIEPEREAAVFFARNLEKRKQAVHARLGRAIDSMVQEALPFDEPRTEDGQQDGNLRPKWRTAYRLGESSYEFNEDKYPVFDSRGRPRVPQVCIDFITDALERASGSWWQPAEQPRSRSTGALSFDAFQIDNKRSVERFTKFAWQEPDHFDVVLLAPEDRIQLRRGDVFYAHLEEHAARYRPGDIVNILGLKSDEKFHYHSFFVYKADPVTGMPIWLASNAGRPRLRSWYGELLSAPRRSIKSRIRPRLDWLESVVAPEQPLATEPALNESSG